MFAGAVEGVAAGAQVGAGEAHEREAGAVGAAADGYGDGIQAGFLDGFFGVVDQVHAGLNLFFHVAILLFDGKGDGSFAVFLIEKLGDVTHHLLAAGEHGAVVVADDVIQACIGYVTAHFTEMEKAFILFCVCRSVSCREHAVELHGNQGGIDHGIFAAARMHGEAFDLYLGAFFHVGCFLL